MIKVIEYHPHYQDQTVEHILEIENDEFLLNLTINDQPDLISIHQSYQIPGGNFWIALDGDNTIVGSIGIFNLGDRIGDMRKLFVKPGYRGVEIGLSELLLQTSLDWATQNGYKKIYLETTTKFAAAIRFYQKHGFKQVEPEHLPGNFPKIKLAELFFVYEL
jgi:N-acetylglutamate synthase-like GNAT family acetyltransferase